MGKNNDFLFMLLFAVLICIVVFSISLFVVGFTSTASTISSTKIVVCSTPYISFRGDCCLDVNYNNICDDVELRQQLITQNSINEAEVSNQVAQLNAQVASLQSQLKSSKDSYNQLLNDQNLYQRISFDDNDKYYYGDYDLSITVRDLADNSRIENARVRIDDGDSDNDYTDSDGEVVFRGLDEDCYDITVSKTGYLSKDTSVCLHDDRDLSIRLEKS